MKKLNDKIRTEKDTLYIFSNDFFSEVDEITEKENELASKLISFIGTTKDDDEEIMMVLQPQQLYHFFINIQRYIQK